MSLTPSEKSMKESTEAVNKGLAALGGSMTTYDYEEMKKAVAFALDQREQSVWEEALKAVPDKSEPIIQFPETGEPYYRFKERQGWEAARFALLSARSKSLKK